jgi:hypothetical protein
MHTTLDNLTVPCLRSNHFPDELTESDRGFLGLSVGTKHAGEHVGSPPPLSWAGSGGAGGRIALRPDRQRRDGHNELCPYEMVG